MYTQKTAYIPKVISWKMREKRARFFFFLSLEIKQSASRLLFYDWGGVAHHQILGKILCREIIKEVFCSYSLHFVYFYIFIYEGIKLV